MPWIPIHSIIASQGNRPLITVTENLKTFPRCDNCGYFCTLTQGEIRWLALPAKSLVLIYWSGHPQQEHETSHGSMSKTQWAIAGPDGTVLQLDGHKFGSDDEGAPMLCSQICRNMDRHLHIDYCRATSDKTCNHAGMQHIMEPMNPNPARTKDWVTHGLSWSRLGWVFLYKSGNLLIYIYHRFQGCASRSVL